MRGCIGVHNEVRMSRVFLHLNTGNCEFSALTQGAKLTILDPIVQKQIFMI